MRAAFVLVAVILLTGCATNFEPQPLPADHPASAGGQEAPRTGMKRLVALDELTRKTKAQLARNEVPNPNFEGGAMSHDVGNMKGMDHSKMDGMEPAKSPVGGLPSPAAASIYTCVMHPEVQQATPGNCPKCGMTLIKKEKAAR